jgi:hypothetical protein
MDAVEQRSALLRRIAKERDTRNRLESTVSKLRGQVDVANAETAPLQKRWGKAADARAQLEAVRADRALLLELLEERDYAVRQEALRYKGVEARAMSLGAMGVNPQHAAKSGAAARADATRVRHGQHELDGLRQREADLRAAVKGLRVNRGGGGGGRTDADSSDPTGGANANSGGDLSGLAQLQAEHEAHRKQALRDTADELARADRALERRREAMEQAGQRERQTRGSQIAHVEGERQAVQRDHAAARQQLASLTDTAEGLRRRIAIVSNETHAASSQNEHIDREVARLQLRAKELQGAVDASLKASVSASAASTTAAQAWQVERKQLLDNIAVAERRCQGVEKEVARARQEVRSSATASVQPAAVPTVTTDSIAKLEGEIQALERQVDEVRMQAAEVEQKNAASQKDEIIAQMRSKLQATHAGTKQLEAENATLMNKIAQAEATLRSRGLHAQ